jgi:hypothetical protein
MVHAASADIYIMCDPVFCEAACWLWRLSSELLHVACLLLGGCTHSNKAPLKRSDEERSQPTVNSQRLTHSQSQGDSAILFTLLPYGPYQQSLMQRCSPCLAKRASHRCTQWLTSTMVHIAPVLQHRQYPGTKQYKSTVRALVMRA